MEKITRFEKARLISTRALQISLGAPAFVKVPKGLSIIEIAKLEFSQQALPLAILRQLPSGEVKRVEVF